MQYTSKPHYLHSPAFVSPELQQAQDAFLITWLPMHSPPAGSQLYHYTTLAGLQGILRGRDLWLGHISCLNDRLEVEYGQKLLAGIFQEAIEREANEGVRLFVGNILRIVNGFGNEMYHPFVGCFCQSGNLLSQWRAYASSGGGYCLGFDFTSATRVTSDISKADGEREPYLRRIIYEEEEQRAIAQEFLGKAMSAARNAIDSGMVPLPGVPMYAPEVMAIQAADTFIDMLLCFKHPAYKSEEEWRMVRVTMDSHEPEEMRFREVAGELLPYRPTHIYNRQDDGKLLFPLRSVGFGPMLEPTRTRAAIQLLLHNASADQHPIRINPHQVQICGAGYSLRRG